MSSLAFFQNMGVPELLIILIIILLLFGGAKLPSLARSLGSSVNEFKKGVKGLEDEVESAGTEHPGGRRDGTNGRWTTTTQPREFLAAVCALAGSARSELSV